MNREARYNLVKDRWECCLCGAELASKHGKSFLELAPGLRQLEWHKGGLPTYGPPGRVRLHGKPDRPVSPVEVAQLGPAARMARRLNIAIQAYFYCANCGAGQHLRLAP